MPAIEIRPATTADIPALSTLDHHYASEYVWQLEMHQNNDLPANLVNRGGASGGQTTLSEEQITITFRQMRLPRSVKVEYPRLPGQILADLQEAAGDTSPGLGLLAALLAGRPIGYVRLSLNVAPYTTWVTDLVVDRPLRRKGIGSALALAAMEWASNMDTGTVNWGRNLVFEMQPKNYPAIQLARKLGFEFCGFNDRHYANHQTGIFFGKSLR